MPRTPKFQLIFASEAIEHLVAIERKQHKVIEQAIDEQLIHTPSNQTRNRKPLRQPAPFGAEWELRCGPQNCFLVFYDVNTEDRSVVILAVGERPRDRLFFAGEEFQP